MWDDAGMGHIWSTQTIPATSSRSPESVKIEPESANPTARYLEGLEVTPCLRLVFPRVTSKCRIWQNPSAWELHKNHPKHWHSTNHQFSRRFHGFFQQNLREKTPQIQRMQHAHIIGKHGHGQDWRPQQPSKPSAIKTQPFSDHPSNGHGLNFRPKGISQQNMTMAINGFLKYQIIILHILVFHIFPTKNTIHLWDSLGIPSNLISIPWTAPPLLGAFGLVLSGSPAPPLEALHRFEGRARGKPPRWSYGDRGRRVGKNRRNNLEELLGQFCWDLGSSISWKVKSTIDSNGRNSM